MDLLQVIRVMREAFQARLLPAFSEVTLPAILHLHPEQYAGYAIAAGLGALLASVSLYAIGVWLRRMPDRVSTPEQKTRIEILRLYANQWLLWLLILAPTPLGCVLIMAAGFFAVPPWKAALAIIAAEILWRISPFIT